MGAQTMELFTDKKTEPRKIDFKDYRVDIALV